MIIKLYVCAYRSIGLFIEEENGALKFSEGS